MRTQIDIISKQDKLFEIIKESVNEIVDLIKPTFGPASCKVIIDRMTHQMVVDDGVQIGRDYESSDKLKNAIIKIIAGVR